MKLVWILFGALLFLLACTSGASVSQNTDAPPSPRATATDKPVGMPTAAPPTRTLPPQKGFLPGLFAADLTVNLKQREFTCTGATKQGTLYVWRCTSSTAAHAMSVLLEARTVTTLDHIDATVQQFTTPDPDLPVQFLGYLASLPYENAAPEQARSWVVQQLPTLQKAGDVRETTIAGVLFRLSGIPTAYTLSIGTLE